MLIIKELLPREFPELVLLPQAGEESPGLPAEFHTERVAGFRFPVLVHRLEDDLVGFTIDALRALAVRDVTKIPSARALPTEHVGHEERELRLVEPGLPPERVPVPGENLLPQVSYFLPDLWDMDPVLIRLLVLLRTVRRLVHVRLPQRFF